MVDFIPHPTHQLSRGNRSELIKADGSDIYETQGRKRDKGIDLRQVTDDIQDIITELQLETSLDPEIEAAISLLYSAKDMLAIYSRRLYNSPSTKRHYLRNQAARLLNDIMKQDVAASRSTKDRYDDFFENHQFDDASSIFEAARQEGFEKDIEEELKRRGLWDEEDET